MYAFLWGHILTKEIWQWFLKKLNKKANNGKRHTMTFEDNRTLFDLNNSDGGYEKVYDH